MKIVVPANPIRIYQRASDETYICMNVAFIVLDIGAGYIDPAVGMYDLRYVTISGNFIKAVHVAFARVLINGEWVSHD
jgi:hypothetical protein